ncbi:MAG: (Fe-S)-binding protein, partial [Desulfobacterales bacterium]|nr:(Fe-S)-binding protein [Desulfobacterales bacterium]
SNRKAGQALPRLLEYAGVSFGSLGIEENCCGDQAHKTGAGDIFSELARKNEELFLRAGVRKILTVSPHCLNAFKNLYTNLRGFIDTEHYSELLDRLLAEGRLRPALEVASVVTYHDPCYLGRHNGIYEAPRRVLQSIPGLKLVEMTNNRESSLCCGGGGGGAWNDYPHRQSLGVLRVKEALGTGAEVIATACPYCIHMLNDAVRDLGVEKQIAVCDLAELLLQSVVARDEANMIGHIDLDTSREVCHV